MGWVSVAGGRAESGRPVVWLIGMVGLRDFLFLFLFYYCFCFF